MSVLKAASNLQPKMEDDDVLLVLKAKEMANEVNMLNTELLGQLRPLDAIAQSLEEMTLLVEFRRSKFNFKLEKIKALKQKFNKSFGVN